MLWLAKRGTVKEIIMYFAGKMRCSKREILLISGKLRCSKRKTLTTLFLSGVFVLGVFSVHQLSWIYILKSWVKGAEFVD